jgi:mono/diheme cytochrome c family protein
MLRKFMAPFLAPALIIAMGCAIQSSAQATDPIKKLTSTDGKAMFSILCTSCHGVDGKGHGPVTIANAVPPVDLTVLSRNNHGRFPEAHVIHVLQYGAGVPTHTAVEMPVWGPRLAKINKNDPNDRMVRIKNLMLYLETLQLN